MSFEALGLLTYLLSLPHDWEVKLSKIRADRRMGKDKLRRIVNELIDLGFIRRFRKRDPLTGTFRKIEYWIFDTPHDSDDEFDMGIDADVQADLFARKPRSEKPTVVKSPEAENPTVDNIPEAGLPAAGNPQPGNGSPYKETNNKKTKNKNTSLSPDGEADGFEDFRKSWKWDDPGDGEYPAKAEWRKLDADQRKDCLAGIAPYQTDCLRRNRKRCFAATFIKDQRWRGFLATKPVETKEASRMLIRNNTIEWAIFRHLVCQRMGREGAKKIDADGKARKSILIKKDYQEVKDARATWVFLEEDSEAFGLWRIFFETQQWPMPEPVSIDEGTGYWFPSDTPPQSSEAVA